MRGLTMWLGGGAGLREFLVWGCWVVCVWDDELIWECWEACVWAVWAEVMGKRREDTGLKGLSMRMMRRDLGLKVRWSSL